MLEKIISKERIHYIRISYLLNFFPIKHCSVPNKRIHKEGENTSALYTFNIVDGTTKLQNTR